MHFGWSSNFLWLGCCTMQRSRAGAGFTGGPGAQRLFQIWSTLTPRFFVGHLTDIGRNHSPRLVCFAGTLSRPAHHEARPRAAAEFEADGCSTSSSRNSGSLFPNCGAQRRPHIRRQPARRRGGLGVRLIVHARGRFSGLRGWRLDDASVRGFAYSMEQLRIEADVRALLLQHNCLCRSDLPRPHASISLAADPSGRA
ncbi:hypothetical protein DENSPDRAFT_102674 [Dentipellis sp. KUC8613]|nr:hypothetical protein DENSPDRAFT_102674 [Dentipellis sp. KUC8613]